MKKIEGWRTFIIINVSIAALLAGFYLIHRDQRGAAFIAFAGALVGLAGVQMTKSVGTAAVGGDGIIQGAKNFLTPSKPGDPKP